MSLSTLEVDFILTIKDKIRQAQYEALREVNVKLINLYWEIGKSIAEKQAESWGKSIVPKLSKELQLELPGISGFSTTNIWYMVQFYTDYQSDINLQPLAGEIGWSKHTTIFSKCKSSQEKQFYILATKKHGWTKNVLINQIENKTFERYLLNQTNFDEALPEKISKHALLAVKDAYTFDFVKCRPTHWRCNLQHLKSPTENVRDDAPIG
ncbi:DUF1016 N-terminal domain-containing protein [Dyadobacter sp. CY326]|uniref:DUF1016 N-terminal domain-containing protein n=1 Tax=Dyadobacter sp. CY326 TaxID=2907300 RepID=UPI001F3BE927|nr:DUF1016 N-terminal domain-containing protein [Dyadobacter sp. CY326]MCE7066350.1 DUF1016 N-terminal domain-containing protein [Dyadobacter sp. CY326]